jgi:hypothetical protein
MPIKQIIRDKGFAAAMLEMKALGHLRTKVGLPAEGEVGAPSNARLGKHEVTVASEMSQIVRIASYHEFGAPRANIPERPFMRLAFENNLAPLQELKKARILAVARGVETAETAIKKIGEWFTARTKLTIRDGGFVPLKPQTIKRKKSSRPLIDTAQMLNSIQHVEERF